VTVYTAVGFLLLLACPHTNLVSDVPIYYRDGTYLVVLGCQYFTHDPLMFSPLSFLTISPRLFLFCVYLFCLMFGFGTCILRLEMPPHSLQPFKSNVHIFFTSVGDIISQVVKIINLLNDFIIDQPLHLILTK
jgi:hypothetical protein